MEDVGQFGVDGEVVVGPHQVDANGQVLLEFGAEGLGDVGAEVGGGAQHGDGRDAGGAAGGGAEADGAVADGLAEGDGVGAGAEDGAKQVGAVGAVDVVDELGGESAAAAVGVHGGANVADDVGAACSVGGHAFDELFGKCVAAKAASAGEEVVDGVVVEAAFVGDPGDGDEVVALEDAVEGDVRGIEEAVEVGGCGSIVGVSEEAVELAEAGFVVGELVAVDVDEGERARDRVEVGGRRVEQECVFDGGFELVVGAPADGLMEVEVLEVSRLAVEPGDEFDEEAAAGALVAVDGGGEDERGVRVEADEALEDVDGELGGFIDDDDVGRRIGVVGGAE